MLPVFSKYILFDGSQTGNMLAGSNAGELVGAFIIAKFSHKFKNFLPIIRLNGLLYGMHWIFVVLAYYWTESFEGRILVLSLNMFIESGTWAAADVC